jgi:hypothetical protein
MSKNIELKYQVSITTGGENGTVEQKVKTPFNINFSDIQQIFIEHNVNSIKRLSIYPNGLVVYFENNPHVATIKTNWPIEKDSDGYYIIVEPKE